MAKNRFSIFKVIRQGHDLDLDNFCWNPFLTFMFTHTINFMPLFASVLDICSLQKEEKKKLTLQFSGSSDLFDLDLDLHRGTTVICAIG